MSVRQPVVDLFRRFYPNYKGESDFFNSEVFSCLLPTHVVLDAGCGSGRMSNLDLKGRSKTVIGVDIDDELRENNSLHHPIWGTLSSLPLQNSSIDLIVCRYVAEHLSQPLAVFLEFARVLRKGGRVVLLTPNQWHYVSLISRFSPFWFHRWFNSSYGVAEEETFPTFYRCNSRRRILNLAEQAGLHVVKLQMIETSPNYLEFSRLLYRLGIAYERLVNRWNFFAQWRVNIIVTLEKPSA
ncbi:MAG: methyltransferase domain-containing protein [Nitrospirae bacterium]|nr:methyltransferase domain-containing protein [Nitrospirota bacterium]